MDEPLVDKELAEWSQSKCCGQWLNVQAESSDKHLPHRLALGSVLFNIFARDIDSGIKCTFSWFVEIGCYPQGHGQVREVSPYKPHEVHLRQGPAPGSGQAQICIEAGR